MRRRRLISAITFSAVLVLAQGAGAGIGFVPGEAINVAPDPDYLLAGDLTKDGRADLVVVSPASREVDVFAASPGAPSHVVPTQSLQFGSRLRGPALGDLNADRRLDLVVADAGTHSIWILIGKRDGTFAAPYSVGRAFYPSSVTIGNFDGSGHPDLAVSYDEDGRVRILRNDNGTPPCFDPVADFHVGLTPIQIATADFNRDHHPDLITLGQLDLRVQDVSVALWERTAQGIPEFVEIPQEHIVVEKATRLFLGDFNNDGAPDVATLNRPGGDRNSQVSTLINQGDGVLGPAMNLDLPCPFFTGGQLCRALAMTLGDFDDNGNVDLMVAMADPRRSGSSAGSLADAVQVFSGRGDGTFVPDGVFATRKAPVSMATGDFNGDDRLDIAVASRRTLDLQVFLNVSRPGAYANGSACSRGEECLSSRCTDGVCCAEECAAHESCDIPSREGTCSPVVVEPVPCTLPEQPECDDGQFCVDGYCCDEECVGGRCAIPGFVGVCIQGIAPGLPCEDDELCTTGFCANELCCYEPCEGGFCDETGVCRPTVPNGEPCEVNSDCQSRVCDEFDLICCNRRCDIRGERCSHGLCVIDQPISLRRETARPPAVVAGLTLTTSNPCGLCPSGTHRRNGVCVADAKSNKSTGCSIVDSEAAGSRITWVALLPLALWIRRSRGAFPRALNTPTAPAPTARRPPVIRRD